MKFIQIAGTKGKGSTSTYLANILTAAGYKCGLFVSPHIRRENERVSIDGQQIPDADLQRLLAQTTESGYFRKFYQVALAWFAEQGVEVAVMETGLGGRYDPATRLPICQLILTRIGMDHMEILGDTIQKIALEKAAAIRMGGSVVSAPQDARVQRIFDATCRLRHARQSSVRAQEICVREDGSFDFDGLCNLRLQNPASLQYVNAAVAVRAALRLRESGIFVSGEAIRRGLTATQLPGRQQYLPGADALIDGAHNVDSLRFLHDTLRSVYGRRRKVLIAAAMQDKDVSYFGQMAADQFEKVFASQLDYERCMRAEQMAAQFLPGTPVELCSGTAEAYEKAAAYARERGAMIVFAGSIYLAGEALDLLLPEERPAGI